MTVALSEISGIVSIHRCVYIIIASYTYEWFVWNMAVLNVPTHILRDYFRPCCHTSSDC